MKRKGIAYCPSACALESPIRDTTSKQPFESAGNTNGLSQMKKLAIEFNLVVSWRPIALLQENISIDV